MNFNYMKWCILCLIPSPAFALGGISSALGFIDSIILTVLILTVIIHAVLVYSLTKKAAFKRIEILTTSILFSAFEIIFWLVQFLDSLANRLIYSWPNYHGGVLLPITLVILMVIIIWTVREPLRQHLHSNGHTDD